MNSDDYNRGGSEAFDKAMKELRGEYPSLQSCGECHLLQLASACTKKDAGEPPLSLREAKRRLAAIGEAASERH